MSFRSILSFTALAMAATSAAGSDLYEFEPNDSITAANLISRGSGPWSGAGEMVLSQNGGDLDYFAIDLLEGEIITVLTTPLEVPLFDPDTMLGLFDSAGTLLILNDDFNGLGSGIRWETVDSGRYYFGVTGAPDRDFIGDHDEDGRYELSIVIVPAPAAMAAMLACGAVISRRRQRTR